MLSGAGNAVYLLFVGRRCLPRAHGAFGRSVTPLIPMWTAGNGVALGFRTPRRRKHVDEAVSWLGSMSAWRAACYQPRSLVAHL